MGPARQVGGFGCKMEGGPLSSKALGGWFNRSILNGSEMPLVKEHILIQSVLPNL
jgi:hypothetical protein